MSLCFVIGAIVTQIESFNKLLLPALWEVVTNLLMPAAAILASGYLAVRVQRKEHEVQAARRRQEDEQAEMRKIAADRHALILKAIMDNDLWLTYLRTKSNEDLAPLIATQSMTYHEWDLSNVPDAPLLGFWLTQKRELVFKQAQNAPADIDAPLGPAAAYFVTVNTQLRDWSKGARSLQWFRADSQRILDDAPSMLDEHEYQENARKTRARKKTPKQ